MKKILNYCILFLLFYSFFFYKFNCVKIINYDIPGAGDYEKKYYSSRPFDGDRAGDLGYLSYESNYIYSGVMYYYDYQTYKCSKQFICPTGEGAYSSTKIMSFSDILPSSITVKSDVTEWSIYSHTSSVEVSKTFKFDTGVKFQYPLTRISLFGSFDIAREISHFNTYKFSYGYYTHVTSAVSHYIEPSHFSSLRNKVPSERGYINYGFYSLYDIYIRYCFRVYSKKEDGEYIDLYKTFYEADVFLALARSPFYTAFFDCTQNNKQYFQDGTSFDDIGYIYNRE